MSRHVGKSVVRRFGEVVRGGWYRVARFGVPGGDETSYFTVSEASYFMRFGVPGAPKLRILQGVGRRGAPKPHILLGLGRRGMPKPCISRILGRRGAPKLDIL